jgi:outer membrane protein TolC
MTLAGCVPPGELDQTVVGKYQRAMAERGFQRRGTEGLEQLKPDEATRPPLKIVTDEQTAEKRLFLSLEEAIMRALANSLDIRTVSFDPAVSREEMVQAAAEFDYVLNAGWEYDRSDEESSSTLATGEVKTRVYSAGISQKLVTGAEAALAYTMTQTLGSSAFSTMNEEWDQRIVLEVTQPLLRGAWPEFNLARLRVARLTYGSSMAEFRRRVEEVITQVISTYWALIQARRELIIQQELVDRTIETRDRIDKRRDVDATDVEFMQAEAAVARREALLVLAEAQIGEVQDQLARLLEDSQLNLLSDYEVAPTTPPNAERVTIDQTDQLITALQHNPLLEQARVAVQIAAVSVRVAESETLPRLDFSLSVTGQGIGEHSNEARRSMETGDFVGYTLGLELEYPIGNRQRIANLRAQKLARLKSIVTMQNTADVVALNVRSRIRRIDAAYREMKEQQRAVEASRNQLSALEASEEIRQMSPEFLQVKLVAQERLAEAERAELRSLVAYNTALIELARETGTVLEIHGVQIAMPDVITEHD